jgi:alcohol dehydrogenase class IV
MRFEFATTRRIIFGPGRIEEIGPIAAGMGSRALVVIGSGSERAAGLLDLLRNAGLELITFRVESEPSVEIVRRGTRTARAEACDLIIGFGGGSPIDTGKAIAALMTNGEDPLDFLEVIGRGKPLIQPSTPYIAIPTTAGTGSEVTRNAVLMSLEHNVKVSLRSPLMLPVLALVDPELTYSLPPSVTASTGLDALSQVIEPFLSIRATPLTDCLCIDGMKRAARSLRRAYQHGDDADARQDMALVSLYGGLALANAGLGAVHGFAGPFGGMFHAPHGATCAAFLPPVMAVNMRAIQERTPDDRIMERYKFVAQTLTGDPKAEPEDGVSWLQDLRQELQIPRLGSYGLSPSEFPALIEKASASSSMRANPVQLTPDEMRQILNLAL